MPTMETTGITSREVCALVGMTYRQLDHAISAYLPFEDSNPGSGNPRRWTPEKVALAFAYAAMQELHLSPTLITRALDALKERPPVTACWLLFTPGGFRREPMGECVLLPNERWTAAIPIMWDKWKELGRGA